VDVYGGRMTKVTGWHVGFGLAFFGLGGGHHRDAIGLRDGSTATRSGGRFDWIFSYTKRGSLSMMWPHAPQVRRASLP
jgi:hypothetical protein